MSKLTHLFSSAELEGLDAKQLDRLRDEVKRHIRTSPEIHRILKAKLRPVHKRLKAKRRGRRKKK
jgi:hypothetical protein